MIDFNYKKAEIDERVTKLLYSIKTKNKKNDKAILNEFEETYELLKNHLCRVAEINCRIAEIMKFKLFPHTKERKLLIEEEQSIFEFWDKQFKSFETLFSNEKIFPKIQEFIHLMKKRIAIANDEKEDFWEQITLRSNHKHW